MELVRYGVLILLVWITIAFVIRVIEGEEGVKSKVVVEGRLVFHGKESLC